MDFNLKVQNIGEQPNIYKDTFSIAHEYGKPEDELLQKRGQLYVVLTIHTSNKFDIKAAASIFIESLKENYYKITDETPLKAIEKSLNQAHETLKSFKSYDETLTLNSDGADFALSFCTALIWNRVLYISYLGDPAAYIIRGSGARDLGTKASGNDVWTNSGILENDDVIVIGTEKFAERFPPSEIINELGGISQKISHDVEKDILAAMLIKVSSTDAIKKTKLSEKIMNATIKGSLSNSIWRVKDKVSKNETLSDKFKFYQSKKAAPISSISSLSGETQSDSTASVSTGGHKRIYRLEKKNKKTSRVIIGVLILGIFGFLNYRLLFNDNSKTTVDDIKSQISTLNEDTIGSVMGELTEPSEQNNKNSDAKEEEPEKEEGMHKVLVNTNTIAEDMVPAAISTVENDGLVLADPESDTVYLYENEDEESIKKAVEDADNLNNMACDSKLCYAYADNSLLVFNPRATRNPDRYLIEDIGQVIDIHPYGNRVYLLTPSEIYGFTLRGASPTKWLDEDIKLQNAKSIAIDGDIFVLEKGTVSKFSDGKITEGFALDTSQLLSPIQIEVSDNYLYILDDTKKAILVFNKDTGEFIEDIGLAEATDFEAPSMFAVSKNNDEDLIFRKGKNIYTVER